MKQTLKEKYEGVKKESASKKRELKSETALEKVRARTMAMQKSEELAETSFLLFQQFKKLGKTSDQISIGIFNEEKNIMELYSSLYGAQWKETVSIDLKEPAVMKKIHIAWAEKTKSSVIDLTGSKLKKYNEYRKLLYDLDYKGKRWVNHIAFFSKRVLAFSTTEPIPNEAIQLLERFAAFFDGTDTRFPTQKQMVQSEKMASFGELTAGIAHEIQNPLNFINNFSEVNNELMDEFGEEAEKGNLDEVKAIAKDIKVNSEKINHHGKRAGDIVKGMLQHSRTSTGVKEPTDINALADEYLRLSYHGLRAKDKSFNATMKTDFDESIGKINIIPQDIGRVLLNLYNNAFYAVSDKLKSCQAEPVEAGLKYEPTVSVTTKKSGNHVLITVSDNGNGIPQKIVDKIFQPFFTTKPTGQGTGLGLSLSYDIVKAHGGEIKVETVDGQGTTFIIYIPVV